MAISRDRLDRFQKYLKSKTLYAMQFYEKNWIQKLQPTWTALQPPVNLSNNFCKNEWKLENAAAGKSE